MLWRLSDTKSLDLSTPCVMSILNITPDSFSDGGESTRPGSPAIPADEQIARVVPAISAIRARLPHTPITIDTTSAPVAHAALTAGADAVNDISAGLDDPNMLALCAQRPCGLILMHRLRPPAADSFSDQYHPSHQPHYRNVVADVTAHLRNRADAALAAGIPHNHLVLDPGLGFGKSVDDNLALIRGTPTLAALGYPILSGLSRKSFTGRVSLNRDSTPTERLPGTLALSVLHMQFGAHIFRVHDVAEHVQALRAAHLARKPVGPP